MANDNPELPVEKNSELATYVTDLFQEFKNGRQQYENKAQEWWNNFLSQYQENTRWRNKEGEGHRSRIFIKLTQQKCYTAHAKVMDAMGTELPFELEALPHLDYSQLPDGLLDEAVNFRKHYISEQMKQEKIFETVDNAVLDATIFPAAIVKGPIMVREKQPVVKRRLIGGMPAEQIDPKVSSYMVTLEDVDKYVCDTVPFWDYYVDVNAKSPKDSIGEFQYTRMLPQKFRNLKNNPGYDKEQMELATADIEALKEAMPDTDNDKSHIQLADKFEGYETIKDGKIPVLEFHGLVQAKRLKDFGAKLPEGVDDDEDVEAVVCIVLAGRNIVIKAQYNYFGYRPFMVFGVKKIPNCVYKNSIAGLMDDSQRMVNSACRMYIDNKALSGNGMIAVHEDKINWQKTGNAQVYPGKTFYLKGNATVKEAMDNVTFADVTFGMKDMIQMFMQIADEESGIPKYSQGEGSQSSYLNKTATGISMIMGASNVNLKPFLANIDDNVINPLVERYDALFSMLGKYPKQYNIPLKVVATGTISLISREIIVEHMMKFLQVTQNPQDNNIVKRREIIMAIGENLGLGKFVHSEAEIAKIEEMLAQKQRPIAPKAQVEIEKLFPLLSPPEQAQILQAVGITPDPRRGQMPGGVPQNPGQAPAGGPPPQPAPGGPQ